MKRCAVCGFVRDVLLRATVYLQLDEASVKTDICCVPCFLRFLKLQDSKGEYDYFKAMKCEFIENACKL